MSHKPGKRARALAPLPINSIAPTPTHIILEQNTTIPRTKNSHRELSTPLADTGTHTSTFSESLSQEAASNLPQKFTPFTTIKSVDFKLSTCPTSPPTTLRFPPSRKILPPGIRMQRIQLSTVRLVEALCSSYFAASIADLVKPTESMLQCCAAAQLTNSVDAFAAANAVKNHPITQSVTNGMFSSFS